MFAFCVLLQVFALLGLVPEHWLVFVQVFAELQSFGAQTFKLAQVLVAEFDSIILHPQVLFVVHTFTLQLLSCKALQALPSWQLFEVVAVQFVLLC